MKSVALFTTTLLAAGLYWLFSSRAQGPVPANAPFAQAPLDPGVSQNFPSAAGVAPSPPSPPPSPFSPALQAASKYPTDPPYADKSGLLRDSHGNLLKLGRSDAETACASFGMRLSTIRELFIWNVRMLESGEQNARAKAARATEEEVHALNPDGKKDDFRIFYDSAGSSLRPEGDIGENWFWSSSKNAENPAEFLSFGGATGYVSSGESSVPDPVQHQSAVRCMPRK